MGNMNAIPAFGDTFSILLPLLLVLMCICNFLNAGNKLMSAIGLGNYAGREDKDGAAEEGKKIIQRG
jgi:hypothetical protein